jgi:hypothetical protein
MRNYFYTLALLTITLFAAQTTSADVKVKSKQTMSGQSYENTTTSKA